MAELQAQQAQQDAVEAASQVVGLATDIAGAVIGGDSKKQPQLDNKDRSQSPDIPSLDAELEASPVPEPSPELDIPVAEDVQQQDAPKPSLQDLVSQYDEIQGDIHKATALALERHSESISERAPDHFFHVKTKADYIEMFNAQGLTTPEREELQDWVYLSKTNEFQVHKDVESTGLEAKRDALIPKIDALLPNDLDFPGADVTPDYENMHPEVRHSIIESARAHLQDQSLKENPQDQPIDTKSVLDAIDNAPTKPIKEEVAPVATQTKEVRQEQKTARAQVNELGKTIEGGLKDILKAKKIELKIYSKNKLVYPPKKGVKLSPELADRLNRAFTDPSSIKGAVNLQLRGEDGKLTPIYRVSNGKVTQDEYGLKNTIASQVKVEPEQAKTQAEDKTEAQKEVPPKKEEALQTEDKPKTQAEDKNQTQTEDKPKAQTEDKPKTQAEDKPKAQTEDKPKAQTEDKPKAQTEDKPKAQIKASPKLAENKKPSPELESQPKQKNTTLPQKAEPTTQELLSRIEALEQSGQAKDKVISEQSSTIDALKNRVGRLESLSSKLSKAGVPRGITKGIDAAKGRLVKGIKEFARNTAIKTADGVKKAGKALDELATNIETNAVHRSAVYVTKQLGSKQKDGSIKMNHGKRFDFKLKGDNLTISRKHQPDKILFQGNSQRSRFTSEATLNETSAIKSIPLTASRIQANQQQRQQQIQPKQVAKAGGRRL